jgi:hypothetical protein
MNWNPSYSYATLPTRVPEDKGLPHFSDVHIWNIKATGAKKAFDVSAYPNATLDNFRIDHLNVEAQTAGTIANAKNWSMIDNTINTADGSKVTFTSGDAIANPKDIPYGEPK